jgi:hypothetical protein
MQGYAFRCDQCKRTTFPSGFDSQRGPHDHSFRQNPPPEWFVVTQAMQGEFLAWPVFHFCQFDCMKTFVNQSADEPDIDIDAEVLLDEPPDEPGETVISEWDADKDLTPFGGLVDEPAG